MTGQLLVASFARDNRGRAPIFDPAEQPPQFGAKQAIVREA
jgi:hypothetical protein